MPRGGRRAGAGRPRKPIEQHLAEGTYRASRHRRWIAPPLLPPPGRPLSPERRWQQLLGEEHPRFTRRQLRLARAGPAGVVEHVSDWRVEEWRQNWRGWDRQFGLVFRLQNECPRPADADELARQRGVGELTAAELVAIVADHVTAFDPTVSNPPGWDPALAQARGEPWREGALRRVGCGSCGARAVLLPATVAAVIPARSLARLRAALARLDDHGFRYALADGAHHFPCPVCGADQYAGPLPDELER